MTERQMVQIPKDSEVYKYLFESDHPMLAKWEVLEQIVKQLPQSKQDRAYKQFCSFVDEMNILYPGSSECLMLLWRFISKRIMKVPDLDGNHVALDNSYFEELKKI